MEEKVAAIIAALRERYPDALCALTDAPFAKAFLEDLPELAAQHEDILQELTRQTERVNKRRQEEKAHRKNVRFGKK